MDSDHIVSSINTQLHAVANVLVKWLWKPLPRASENWWDECEIDNLSCSQRETAGLRGFTQPDILNL